MTRQEKIVSMFNDIAPTYDRANRVLSMGVDTFWRKRACDLAFGYCESKNVARIVDVACGTGDMMGYWKRRGDGAGIVINEIVACYPLVLWCNK